MPWHIYKISTRVEFGQLWIPLWNTRFLAGRREMQGESKMNNLDQAVAAMGTAL